MKNGNLMKHIFQAAKLMTALNKRTSRTKIVVAAVPRENHVYFKLKFLAIFCEGISQSFSCMYSRQRSLLENIIIKCKLKRWPCWAQHSENILYSQAANYGTDSGVYFQALVCLWFGNLHEMESQGLISLIRNFRTRLQWKWKLF